MKHRAAAQEPLVHAGRERRGDDQRDKGTGAKLEQEQLDRQDDAGDGRVECRGHARAGAAGQQHFALGRRGRNHLAHDRAERAAGLDDRPLGAERAACANGDGGGKRLENGDLGLDAAARNQHRLHRFRDAVPFDFRRAVLHHQTDDQAADHRHDDDPGAELVGFRAAEVERPDVIKGQVGEQADQVVQDESDQARRQADARRQQGHQSQAIAGRGLRWRSRVQCGCGVTQQRPSFLSR